MSDISCSSDEFDCEDGGYSGEFMNDRYVAIRRLGMGAFAQVWLSYDIKTSNYYAIKIHGSSDTDYAYGEIELDVLKKVRANKIKYANFHIDDFIWENDEDEHFCIVYELLAGNLADIINTSKYEEGMPIKAIKRIIIQVLKALTQLHKQCKMIHTDIKVENILYEGTNTKVNEIIDKFDKYDFAKTLRDVRKKGRYKSMGISAVASKLAHKIVDDLNDQFSSDSSDSSNDGDGIDIVSGIAIDDIEDINVRLSDFGTCEPFINKGREIQCRHYRAPEVIIGYPYNEKCDIWSIGCIVYELATGDLLFEPNKTKLLNRDRHHLIDIYSLYGPLPQDMINKAKRRHILFRHNGLIKSVHYIQPRSLQGLLQSKATQITDAKDLGLLESFINDCLVLDPGARLSADDCLNHPFLSN
jgi:serine/threonine-protein kinase SRPK3